MLSVLDRLRALLDEEGVEYRVVEHGETRTSEESAAARGEHLRIGGKALVLKVGDEFGIFVLSAADKLDSGAIKKAFGVKKVRFATPDELLELTGLVPGSVPPFGEPLLPLRLHVDERLRANPRIAFNAGSLTTSVILAFEDYIRLARPRFEHFARPASE